MANVKTSWLSALNEVFGNRIGSELTQAEAERMFFPFYDKANSFQFLRRHENEIAHVMLYGDERCVYKIIDKDQYDKFLSLDFTGVEIGELTELGFIPIDNNWVGYLLVQPEITQTVDFFEGSLDFEINSDKVHTNRIKLFGNKIYVQCLHYAGGDTGRVVVYAKYKPHSLSFDYLIPKATQSSSYWYFNPCITSGYRLTSCVIHVMAYGGYTLHLFKKAAGDLGNDVQISAMSFPSLHSFADYEMPLNGTGQRAFITHYRDVLFGGTGTISVPNSNNYQARLTFEKIP